VTTPQITQVGIIGFPLGHTISPAFHQAALDALGLAWRYTAWRTAPEELAARVQGFREPHHAGSNVTVPHKEMVLKLLDQIDPVAKRIAAVNTIVNREGHLHGYNTDAPGFIRGLREDGGFEPRGKHALVLGAGGAAKGIAFALADAGVADLTVTNRSPGRSAELAQMLRRDPALAKVRVHLAPWGAAPEAGTELIVNTTTLGMRGGAAEQESPLAAKQIPAGALVNDLVYTPPETPLLRMAKQAGARTLGGLPMLIYQGAYSFELWTGKKPPIEVMFAAARKALATTHS